MAGVHDAGATQNAKQGSKKTYALIALTLQNPS